VRTAAVSRHCDWFSGFPESKRTRSASITSRSARGYGRRRGQNPRAAACKSVNGRPYRAASSHRCLSPPSGRRLGQAPTPRRYSSASHCFLG
jgi:hypothetical protein